MSDVKWGSEFLVNTSTTGSQLESTVAALANGFYVAVWKDNGDNAEVTARVYHATGESLTGEISVGQSSPNYPDAQGSPVVAGLTDGRFVVVWESGTAGSTDIKARVYNANGTPVAGEFTVNTSTAHSQHAPAIAALTGGGFAITWHSDDQSPGDYNIRARAYNSTATALGNDFLVDNSIAEEHLPAIAGLSNGNYVIAWEDGGDAGDGETDGSHSHLRAEVFSGNGTSASGGEFVVNTTTEGAQHQPSIAGLNDGTFVVSWTDGDNANGNYYADPDIYVRTFQNNGTPIGNDFWIGAYVPSSADMTRSSISALPDGSFFLTFEQNDEIHAMIVDPTSNGGYIGSNDWIVNTTTNGGQWEPTVATLVDGRAVVLWGDSGQNPGDTSGTAVRGQIMDPREHGDPSGEIIFGKLSLGCELVGTTHDDSITGGFSADTLYGMDGKDTLKGGGGADVLIGGTGDDWYFVDSASDQVIEVVGGGANDRVFTSVNYALGTGQEIDILTTTENAGTSPLTLTGNELDNTIFGNAGDNKLKGAGGTDTLVGLGGNDWHFVDNASDVVIEGPSDGAVDRIFTGVSYTLGAGVYVESFTTADNFGTANLSLTGNELDNTIYGNAGSNIIKGAGGADTLLGMAGDDWYHVDNPADIVFEAAGEGADRVLASVDYMLGAGVQVETLSTDSTLGLDNINLTGNELSNSVLGNAGSNAIKGMAGNDVLYGGSGIDAFVFNTMLNAVTNVDTILDFSVVDDDIILHSGIFTTIAPGMLTAGAFVIGPAAADASDRIIYDSATGALYYDADGLGGAAQIQFAGANAGLALTNGDFLIA